MISRRHWCRLPRHCCSEWLSPGYLFLAKRGSVSRRR